MGDFLAFRRNISPLLIQVLFWAGAAACIGLGVMMIMDRMDTVFYDVLKLEKEKVEKTPDKYYFVNLWNSLPDKNSKILWGCIVAIGGPFLLRILCEWLMIGFRINDTLTDIRNLGKPHAVGAGTAPGVGAPRR